LGGVPENEAIPSMLPPANAMPELSKIVPAIAAMNLPIFIL
jgi:hypothetical protein